MNALLPNAFRLEPASRTGESARLAADLVVQFRHHSHFNNVLTHVSGANWPAVEQALARLLANSSGPLDALSVNVLALLSGERGVTGRLMKPWFAEQLRYYTSPARCRSIERRLARLHARYAAMPVMPKKSAARILRDAR